MHVRRLLSATLASAAVGASLVGASGATAQAAPRPDPWVQGQIDAQTEDVPGFLNAINASGIDRTGINDRDLAIKGRNVCGQIYAARGDLSGAALPHTAKDDWHSMRVVAGASIKYLCPAAAEYAPGLSDEAI